MILEVDFNSEEALYTAAQSDHCRDCDKQAQGGRVPPERAAACRIHWD